MQLKLQLWGTLDSEHKFMSGHIPWNSGTKGIMVAWNKLPTKTILCKCCGEPFEDNMNSKRIYASGHYQKLMLSDKNPAKNKETQEKIRTTLLNTYKEHPEILINRKPCGINQHSGSFSSIEKIIADVMKSINLPYNHNYKIRRYYADFLIFNDVIIECDGEYWHKDKEKDSKRDSNIMDDGYYIFRLPEERIKKDPFGCIISTIEILQHMGHRHASLFNLPN